MGGYAVHNKILEVQEIPLDEALEKWHNELEFQGLPTLKPAEEIDVKDSLGRVTAFPVVAKLSSPHYYAAAVDGVAVRSVRTFSATAEIPVSHTVGQDAFFVDTGGALPEGCDAVLPVNEVTFTSTDEFKLEGPVVPWRNVRPAGEDMAAKELILPQHQRIRPLDIGAMLAGGVAKVQVREMPRIGILPLGTNLVNPGCPPQVGQMIEYNSYILGSVIHEMKAEAALMDILPEKPELLKERLGEVCKDYDAILIIAGPQAGTGLIAWTIQQLGDLVVYGINIKPGQSVCLGIVDDKPLIGLSGYAVSCYLSFDLFAKPLIQRMMGLAPEQKLKVRATLARDVDSPRGIEEYLRVNLGRPDSRTVSIPISRGAAMLMNLVRADGLLRIPAETTAIPQGTSVDIELLDPGARYDGNIVALGTHDLAFDILRNELMWRFPDLKLVSSNIGSKGGLRALRMGYAHFCGVHLLDEETGEYNVPYISQSLEDFPVVLVAFFRRTMGLLVKEGNPRNIRSLSDLTREGVTFINRHRGSGTRALIDHLLRKENIAPATVAGYEKEAFTHMSLAHAVASGAADTGIGIFAAAKALHLEMIPLHQEHFDLVIPKKIFNGYQIQSLLKILRSAEFRREMGTLGGYDVAEAGKIVFEQK
jgi:putative molybdopterin biosynthesis protein